MAASGPDAGSSILLPVFWSPPGSWCQKAAPQPGSHPVGRDLAHGGPICAETCKMGTEEVMLMKGPCLAWHTHAGRHRAAAGALACVPAPSSTRPDGAPALTGVGVSAPAVGMWTRLSRGAKCNALCLGIEWEAGSKNCGPKSSAGVLVMPRGADSVSPQETGSQGPQRAACNSLSRRAGKGLWTATCRPRAVSQGVGGEPQLPGEPRYPHFLPGLSTVHSCGRNAVNKQSTERTRSPGNSAYIIGRSGRDV